MPIAECGALLPRSATVNINSPKKNFDIPLLQARTPPYLLEVFKRARICQFSVAC